jgi:molybdopterin synthase catalytic subunit
VSLFSIQLEPIDLASVVHSVQDPRFGGLDLFLGIVRSQNAGRTVTLLEYEAYGSMAIKQLERIAHEIQQQLGDVALSAVHRIGALEVGDTAVICAAAAPHRAEAFAACRLLIDRIKAEVPVWKREHGPDGPYWVGWEDARCLGDEHHEQHQHTARSITP